MSRRPWLARFQSPTTPWGKSARDGLLAGVSAFLLSLADTPQWADWAPLLVAVSTMALAQTNRLHRDSPPPVAPPRLGEYSPGPTDR